jgi:hypothetical protein
LQDIITFSVGDDPLSVPLISPEFKKPAKMVEQKVCLNYRTLLRTRPIIVNPASGEMAIGSYLQL